MNTGDVAAGANGIFLRSYDTGSNVDSDITLTNSGAIVAEEDGIYALTLGSGSDITITNIGDIVAGDDWHFRHCFRQWVQYSDCQ